MTRRLRDRLFRLATGRATHAADLDDELTLHLDLLAEELTAGGMDPVAARREAERRFGDRHRIGQTVRAIDAGARRQTRRRELMQRLMQDVRVAARTLVRQPLFALSGIVIVALGIGAATAMFTVLNAAFLRPFPYPDTDHLMFVFETARTGGKMQVAGPNATDWTRETRLFPDLAYFNLDQSVLSEAGEAQYTRISHVSRPFAQVLGIKPLAGRWFSAEESRKGGAAVAVMSEQLWRRRFGAKTALVGSSVQLDGNPVSIVGIMPSAFAYPVGTDLWLPAEPINSGTSRTAHNWRVLARLAPGMSRETAQQELSVVTRRLVADEKGGDEYIAAGAAIVPFREQLIGDSGKVLLLLQGAVLLVLLIAAVNLTNLTLARAVRREGEVSICLALGARRGDVLRRFASENLLITMAGGLIGLMLAGVMRGLLDRWVGRMLPFVTDLPLDPMVAAFAFGLAVVVGLASSLVPAWRAGRGAMGFTVSRGGTASHGSRRLIDGLMAAEVALAVILVSGAGLVGRSLIRLGGVDPGFNAEDRTVALVPLRFGPALPLPDKAAAITKFDQLLGELRAEPGTSSVGATSALPLWTYSADGSAEVEGTPSASGGPPASAEFRIVSPDYFRSVEVPVRKGREFLDTDVTGSPYVAVVNDAFVRKYLQGSDPLTRRVRFPGMDSDEDPWAAVVGVVGDTRQDGLATEPAPAIYYSFKQRYSGHPLTIVVHSSQPPAAILADLKDRVARIDRDIPFKGKVWSDVVHDSLALPRIRSVLLALFATIALLLSAAGIGAVVAFAVAQRTREIGLRIAVGAPPASLTRDGIIRAGRPVVVGIAIGVVGALVLGRLAAALLYDLAPSDPATLAGAVGVTMLVALVAAYLPARRALRVDPLTALRSE